MSTYKKQDPKLIGDVNESLININGVQAKALLDTGSCVSIVSKEASAYVRDQ